MPDNTEKLLYLALCLKNLSLFIVLSILLKFLQQHQNSEALMRLFEIEYLLIQMGTITKAGYLYMMLPVLHPQETPSNLATYSPL